MHNLYSVMKLLSLINYFQHSICVTEPKNNELGKRNVSCLKFRIELRNYL